jgi:hypothetical protein
MILRLRSPPESVRFIITASDLDNATLYKEPYPLTPGLVRKESL